MFFKDSYPFLQPASHWSYFILFLATFVNLPFGRLPKLQRMGSINWSDKLTSLWNKKEDEIEGDCIREQDVHFLDFLTISAQAKAVLLKDVCMSL